MREPSRDKERLQHIIEAADLVIEHSKGLTYEVFLNDKLRYGALVYYTMIIGEAGYMLSHEFVERYNEVPWADIAGMRHHIVHGYYKVDNRVLWNIIKNDIAPLRMQVQLYLDNIDWIQWASNPLTDKFD